MAYDPQQQTDGNSPPMPFARERTQKAQNTPSRVSPSQYEMVQGFLNQYAYYQDMPKPSTDKFPEIMAPGRHGVLTQWFHRAPFGQPRGVDLVTLRKLAESPFITMCKEARIDQVTSLPWDVVPPGTTVNRRAMTQFDRARTALAPQPRESRCE